MSECEGVQVDFFAEGESVDITFTPNVTDPLGEITQYCWDFGDGQTEIRFDSTPFVHSYSYNDLYQVTLTVKGADCENTYGKSVNVPCIAKVADYRVYNLMNATPPGPGEPGGGLYTPNWTFSINDVQNLSFVSTRIELDCCSTPVFDVEFSETPGGPFAAATDDGGGVWSFTVNGLVYRVYSPIWDPGYSGSYLYSYVEFIDYPSQPDESIFSPQIRVNVTACGATDTIELFVNKF